VSTAVVNNWALFVHVQHTARTQYILFTVKPKSVLQNNGFEITFFCYVGKASHFENLSTAEKILFSDFLLMS
jgi:hypothetical protein